MCLPNAQDAASEFHRTRQSRFVSYISCHDHATAGVGISAEIFRRTVDDEIGTKFERTLEIRRCERAIDNELRSDRVCDLGDSTDIENFQQRIRDRFRKQDARLQLGGL